MESIRLFLLRHRRSCLPLSLSLAEDIADGFKMMMMMMRRARTRIIPPIAHPTRC